MNLTDVRRELRAAFPDAISTDAAAFDGGKRIGIGVRFAGWCAGEWVRSEDDLPSAAAKLRAKVIQRNSAPRRSMPVSGVNREKTSLSPGQTGSFGSPPQRVRKRDNG